MFFSVQKPIFVFAILELMINPTALDNKPNKEFPGNPQNAWNSNKYIISAHKGISRKYFPENFPGKGSG